MSYLLFEYDDYYPLGGWNDLVGEYSTIQEALAELPEHANFDIVEVDWENQEFTDIDVYNLSPWKELWEERNRQRAAKSRAEYEETIRSITARARQIRKENEIGQEATNAFIEFFTEGESK